MDHKCNYNIITYIEQLLERRYTYSYYPQQMIEDIFNKIKNSIYPEWRTKYKRVGNKFDEWLNSNKLDIYKKIFENIFNIYICNDKLQI